MAWSDRRYTFRGPSSCAERQPQDGVIALLGITIGLHVLKVLLTGMGAIEPGRGNGSFERWFGVSAEGLGNGHLWQVLTYPFVHGGLFHLVWYMLLLFLAGRILEGIVGTKRFVALFLACGAGGALGALFDHSGTPTIGAGGSIMGIFVILLVLAPNLPINLIFFPIRLRWVVFILAAIDFCLVLGGPAILDNPSPALYWTPLFAGMTGFAGVWVWPRVLRPRVGRLRKRREHRRGVEDIERSLFDERELDRILAKINREGMGSLTDRERRFLKRASLKYQETRRS